MKVVLIVAADDSPHAVLSRLQIVGTHLDAVWLRCEGQEVRLNPHGGLSAEDIAKSFGWFAKPAVDTPDG